MESIKIGPQSPPPMHTDKDANFAVIDLGDHQVFVEKEEDKRLTESVTKFMTDNGVSWSQVVDYKEAYMDPEEVAEFAYTQGLPKIEIMYHNDNLTHVEINPNGNFLDLRSAERAILNAGEWRLIDLGVSIKLPQGFWGQLVPRSSLFKNHGLLVANSFGVIDTSYCGEDDHWMLSVYATRDTIVEFDERIAQFRIVRDIPFAVFETDKLDDPSRGGFGSTGVE